MATWTAATPTKPSSAPWARVRIPSRTTSRAFSSEAMAMKLAAMANTRVNSLAACRATANTSCEALMKPSRPPKKKVWARV